MTERRDDSGPPVGRTFHGATVRGTIPGTMGLEPRELLAVGNPAVVLNRPSVCLPHPFLDLRVGRHCGLGGCGAWPREHSSQRGDEAAIQCSAGLPGSGVSARKYWAASLVHCYLIGPRRRFSLSQTCSASSTGKAMSAKDRTRSALLTCAPASCLTPCSRCSIPPTARRPLSSTRTLSRSRTLLFRYSET